jgi:hypothetical protein
VATESAARAERGAVARKYASLLHGRAVTFHGVRAGSGFGYRVRIGRLARDAADALCAQLKAASAACDVGPE